MVKRIALFSLRLMMLNIVAFIITFFLIGIENAVVQWIISALMTFVLWLFVWVDCRNRGQKDVQKDKIIRRKVEQEGYVPERGEGGEYVWWFGFAAGLAAQAPALLLLLASLFVNDAVRVILFAVERVWFLTYAQVMMTLEGALPALFFAFIALFSVVSGLAYLTGPAQQRKLETIIERNKARKAARVQDDKKNKKKLAQQRRNPNRR